MKGGTSFLGHLIPAAIVGSLVCAVIGGVEGLRAAMDYFTHQGADKDAGVALLLFGPLMAVGFFFAGALIGALIGAVAGAALGALLGYARIATAGRTDCLGRPAVWRALHAGIWIAVVLLEARDLGLLDGVLARLSLEALRPGTPGKAAAPSAAPQEPAEEAAEEPPARFVVLSEDRVVDSQTRLEWMRGGATRLSSAGAARFCKAAGMTVPTLEQLHSTLHWEPDAVSRVHRDAFPHNEDDLYWTRTRSQYRNWLWTVRVLNATTEPAPDSALHAVRCVIAPEP